MYYYMQNYQQIMVLDDTMATSSEFFGEIIAVSLNNPNLTGYADSIPWQYESAWTALNMSMSFRTYFILSG